MTSSLFVDSTFAVALWIAIKATALIGIAALVQLALRRASAAARHLVWMLTVFGLFLLPAAWLVLPEWRLPVRSVSVVSVPTAPFDDRVEPLVEPVPLTSVALGDNVPATTPATPELAWSTIMTGIYCAGLIGMLTYLLLQQWTIRRIGRRASVVHAADWLALLSDCVQSFGVSRAVRLLRNRESTMPITFGTTRPSILIPAIADTWPEERRRAVMLHELAHIARYDCLTQTLAWAVCAMYWFHPAAWWVARRLRIERELACDDRVLQAGTGAREYAGHLLEIAYSPSGHRAPALAVGMARSRHLEGRMLAALDAARNRAIPGIRTRMAGVMIVVTVLAAIAGARPTVVASASDTPSVAPMNSANAAEPQAAVVGPHLKAIEWPFHDVAPVVGRSLLRAFDALWTMAGLMQDAMGAWELRLTSTKGVVNLRLTEGRSSSGSNVSLDKLEGLTAAQLEGAGGMIAFQLRRDAGTFVFEGVTHNAIAAGTFSFKPDSAFPAELARRGFSRPTSREQYEMARHDVGFALIDELNRQGYTKPSTSELVQAGQHGVGADYVRELGALGQRLGTLDKLITLRDHGVTPAYIRELEELGYKGLSADELRNARDHGISPDYVRGMRDAGYGSLPLDELVNARDHGVSPEFVRELGDAGHRKLPLEQLIGARDHGVSAEYARELRQLGYALPLNDLVNARDHGVSAEYVRDMVSLGYRALPMDSLITLRDHGVTPQYVRELKSLGYDQLSADDLRMLRDHAMTPDRIRSANARAGTRLPIDMLRALAAGGMR